ncbi:MAG: hypothetical protein PVG65_05220 [Candidatus Thorarchaeota archaeon]
MTILLSIGCTDHHESTDENLPRFNIHNAVLYYLENSCWEDYNTSTEVLWNCDHIIIDESWYVDPGSYLLLDVHITDEAWNTKYINVEVRNEQDKLMWTQSIYDYEIKFLDKPGTQYAVGLILYIPYGIEPGIHMIDIWLVGHDGRKTDVYTVEIQIELT